MHLLDHPSSVGQLDLRAMLTVVDEFKVDNPIYMERDFAVDDQFLVHVRQALIDNKQLSITVPDSRHLNNCNKSVGGQLAIDLERILNHELADIDLPAVLQDQRGRRYLREASVNIATHGSAGQSYGAFCNDGMVLEHTGTCNDGVGKTACGGQIVVHAPASENQAMGNNVLIGNFALFGATGGRVFIEGQAGDRFAVRNSGANAVIEGCGDNGCEYMTGGRVVVLGETGRNFAAGMSGGIAFVYDRKKQFHPKVNPEMVILEKSDEEDSKWLEELITHYVKETKSVLGKKILEDWQNSVKHFVKVVPVDYKRVMEAAEAAKISGRDETEAVMAASRK